MTTTAIKIPKYLRISSKRIMQRVPAMECNIAKWEAEMTIGWEEEESSGNENNSCNKKSAVALDKA